MSNEWVSEASNRLKNLKLPHYSYELARSRLGAEALLKADGKCISVVGPSHVGKTSLAKELERQANTGLHGEMLERRAVARIVCGNGGDRGTFTAKLFYRNALERLGHPMFTTDETDLTKCYERRRRQDRETVAVLEGVFEDVLRVLSTKYLVIDETQHLRYMVGKEKSALQMLEFFKTLAEKLNILLIFVGAYPIIDVLRLSPHLLARTSFIHIERYRGDSEDDVAEFDNLLLSYSKGIEFGPGVKDLRKWREELMTGSFGVVGLLSSWLNASLSEVLARNDQYLTLSHIQASRLPPKIREPMWREISMGEDSMLRTKASFPEFSTASKTPDHGKSKNNRPFQAKVMRREEGNRL